MSDGSLDSPEAALLYCRCAYAQVVPKGVKDAVLEGLCAKELNFDAVTDLCDMAARRDPRLEELASLAHDGRPLRIAACFPRAVRGLFTQAGFPLPPSAEILNMRDQMASVIVQRMAGEAPVSEGSDAEEEAEGEGDEVSAAKE